MPDDTQTQLQSQMQADTPILSTEDEDSENKPVSESKSWDNIRKLNQTKETKSSWDSIRQSQSNSQVASEMKGSIKDTKRYNAYGDPID
jgi:hypothetical protein